MPYRRGRKTESTFHNVKRKTKQEEKKKKKKIITKTKRKIKKTKKERRELVQRACINRSASLSLPLQNLTFLQKKKTQPRTFPLGQ